MVMRTHDVSDAEVEAAARAMYERAARTAVAGFIPWSQIGPFVQSIGRDDARAALAAAAAVRPTATDPAVARQVEATGDAERVADLEREVERLTNLVYVPGLWRCPKCKFNLVQGSINAIDGTMTVRDEPGDRCPNCDVPLRRVTERDSGNDMVDRATERLARALAAEARAEKTERERDEWKSEAEDLFDMRYQRDAAEARAQAAEAEDARLRAVLRPFADAADDLDDEADSYPIWETAAAMGIDARDLRRARAALASQGSEAAEQGEHAR